LGFFVSGDVSRASDQGRKPKHTSAVALPAASVLLPEEVQDGKGRSKKKGTLHDGGKRGRDREP